jgi:hypothetical protein
MRMKTVNLKFGLFLAAVFALTGCGDSGVSSSDVASYYKGTTTQAAVTPSNAKALSVGVIDGFEETSFTGAFVKSATKAPKTYPDILQIANILENSIAANIDVKSTVAKKAAAVVNHTVNGASGSFTLTVSDVNLINSSITGSIELKSYQENSFSPTITGKVNFYAKVTASGDIQHMDVTLIDLQGVESSHSYTLNGNITDLNYNNGTTNLNLSLVLQDNATMKTYWMKDSSIVATDTTMSITGVYYTPDYGYVTITTETPITITSRTAGQFLFTGSSDTKGRLTYTGAVSTVEVYDNVNKEFVVVP